MSVAPGSHIILYIIFARIGVAIMVVSVSVAMTEIVGAKMATAEHVGVGSLGCDIARVVFGGYLGEKLV